jgi:hypothetical protein
MKKSGSQPIEEDADLQCHEDSIKILTELVEEAEKFYELQHTIEKKADNPPTNEQLDTLK